jgi:integrase
VEEEKLFLSLPLEYHVLVLIALHTGMRKTEQLSLKWEDVDFRQKVITVRESKAGKARHIPMNQVVVDRLQHLPRMINNPYVFHGALEGERLKDLPKGWEECLEKAGIRNFRWHDLRHTFASRLVMQGVDLYSVKELLG